MLHSFQITLPQIFLLWISPVHFNHPPFTISLIPIFFFSICLSPSLLFDQLACICISQCNTTEWLKFLSHPGAMHYDRLPAAIDPSLLMARNIAHYGETTASLIRGQYESGAYSSSKATIAGDFATAKQMASGARPPFPPTPNSKDMRMSPHQEPPGVGKRFSPALAHPVSAASHLDLIQSGLPPGLMQYAQVRRLTTDQFIVSLTHFPAHGKMLLKVLGKSVGG